MPVRSGGTGTPVLSGASAQSWSAQWLAKSGRRGWCAARRPAALSVRSASACGLGSHTSGSQVSGSAHCEKSPGAEAGTAGSGRAGSLGSGSAAHPHEDGQQWQPASMASTAPGARSQPCTVDAQSGPSGRRQERSTHSRAIMPRMRRAAVKPQPPSPSFRGCAAMGKRITPRLSGVQSPDCGSKTGHGSGLPAGPDPGGFGKLAQDARGGVPVHAAIGDALPVAESLAGPGGLAALHQIALQHDARDGGAA